MVLQPNNLGVFDSGRINVRIVFFKSVIEKSLRLVMSNFFFENKAIFYYFDK
jgi:hypothetical protein